MTNLHPSTVVEVMSHSWLDLTLPWKVYAFWIGTGDFPRQGTPGKQGRVNQSIRVWKMGGRGKTASGDYKKYKIGESAVFKYAEGENTNQVS